MKFSKLSAVSLSAALILLAGCDIDKPYERISGIDSSKACPENFELDVDGMSPTSISLFWDGKQAVADGALSFTVQLTDSLNAAGDNYSALAKTVASMDDAGNVTEACSFSKLSKGARYFVRIRANYAYSVYSEWVYLKRDDITVQVSVGNGLVISEFVAPQDLVATAKTYSSIAVSWSLTGPADGYQIEYAKAGTGEWTVVAEDAVDASFIITHLEQETAYDVRVKAFKIEDGEKVFTDYSTVSGVQTPVKPDFAPAITTAEQLSRFFAEIAEQSANTDVYTLENDIDMTGYDIISAKTFAGTLDGKNHSIKNWSNGGEPLFQVNEGTIKNLVIDASCQLSIIPGTTGFFVGSNAGTIEGCVNNADGTCTGNLTTVTYFGAIAGRTTGLVKDCANNGNITFATSAGDASNNFIGGVVGQFDGAPGVVMIENCTNTGDVKFNTENTPKKMYIGGVVGGSVMNNKGAKPANNLKDYGIVKGCTNTGAVSHVWGVNASGSYCNVGGVAGYIEGAIEGCTNKGAVTLQDNDNPAASSTRPALGGVVGYVTRGAKDCVNEGHVVGKGVWAAGTEGDPGAAGMHQPLFGGVIGGAGELYQDCGEGLVSGCINKGTVDLEVCQKVKGGTQSAGGGVVGYSSINISDCHNQGELNIGLWHKVARVGGVIGWSYAKTIDKCTNSGALTFDCNSAALGSDGSNFYSYQDYVGGIVGVQGLTGGAISDCENSATVTYKGGVTQAVLNYIGSIMGSYSGSGHTMTGCKNSGKVVIDSKEAMCVGSLCGAFNGTMTGCESTGDVEVKNCIGIAGKEPEIGSFVGYSNASFTDCTVNNNVTIEAAGASYYGGVTGGFGQATTQWSGCTVNTNLTVSGTVTTARLIGRYRNDGSGCTVYYKDMTFGGNIGSLGLLGFANNGAVQEGTMPTE